MSRETGSSQRQAGCSSPRASSAATELERLRAQRDFYARIGKRKAMELAEYRMQQIMTKQLRRENRADRGQAHA